MTKEKQYDPEVIRSAHAKQLLKAHGTGGIVFTTEEQEVLDNHVLHPDRQAEIKSNA